MMQRRLDEVARENVLVHAPLLLSHWSALLITPLRPSHMIPQVPCSQTNFDATSRSTDYFLTSDFRFYRPRSSSPPSPGNIEPSLSHSNFPFSLSPVSRRQDVVEKPRNHRIQQHPTWEVASLRWRARARGRTKWPRQRLWHWLPEWRPRHEARSAPNPVCRRPLLRLWRTLLKEP